MKKFKTIWRYILGLPKTLYFNFKYFPFSIAIRFPVFVSHQVILKSTKGKIQIMGTGGGGSIFGLVRIGFGDIGIFDYTNSRSIWECAGEICFHGRAYIGHGTKISVGSNGKLTFGDNFSISAETQIVCSKRITFGNDVLISWQCLFMDTDCHKIIKDSKRNNPDADIYIGDKVWIGCRSTILKGVNIPDGCIVAANSNVIKSVNREKVIIGGNPAKIINENIEWTLM